MNCSILSHNFHKIIWFLPDCWFQNGIPIEWRNWHEKDGLMDIPSFVTLLNSYVYVFLGLFTHTRTQTQHYHDGDAVLTKRGNPETGCRFAVGTVSKMHLRQQHRFAGEKQWENIAWLTAAIRLWGMTKQIFGESNRTTEKVARFAVAREGCRLPPWHWQWPSRLATPNAKLSTRWRQPAPHHRAPLFHRCIFLALSRFFLARTVLPLRYFAHTHVLSFLFSRFASRVARTSIFFLRYLLLSSLFTHVSTCSSFFILSLSILGQNRHTGKHLTVRSQFLFVFIS